MIKQIMNTNESRQFKKYGVPEYITPEERERFVAALSAHLSETNSLSYEVWLDYLKCVSNYKNNTDEFIALYKYYKSAVETCHEGVVDTIVSLFRKLTNMPRPKLYVYTLVKAGENTHLQLTTYDAIINEKQEYLIYPIENDNTPISISKYQIGAVQYGASFVVLEKPNVLHATDLFIFYLSTRKNWHMSKLNEDFAKTDSKTREKINRDIDYYSALIQGLESWKEEIANLPFPEEKTNDMESEIDR